MLSQADDTSMSHTIIEQFVAMYQKLHKDNLDLLADIYAPEVVFVDPLHQLSGLAQLTQYFEQLYQNINSIKFEIADVQQGQGRASIFWSMYFTHPKLAQGKTIKVEGVSHLKFNHKIYYHRDYFDVGQMLYEHIPCIGNVISFIKHKAANS